MSDRRYVAIEAALRHARGIMASEIADLTRVAMDRAGLAPDEHAEFERRGRHYPGTPTGRAWAQIRERQAWIASWDRALEGAGEPSEGVVEPSPGIAEGGQ